MSTRITLHTLHQINRTADRLGAKLPKSFVTGAASLLELDQRATAFVRTADAGSTVAAAVLDALAQGNDPMTDTDVHAAVIRRGIVDAREQVAGSLYRRAEQFLSDHADAVLAAFKPAVQAAGAKLAAAVETLGADTELVAEEILKRGPQAAQAWTDVRAAEATVADVLTVRKLLTGYSRIRNVGRYAVLTIADAPPQDLARPIDQSIPRAWDIVRQGWTLALATTEELERRIAAAMGEQDSANQAQRDAFRDGFRRTNGIGALA